VTLSRERSQSIAALAAAAVGVAWFGLHVGFSVVRPTNIAWLMDGDLATHYLGWAFYRVAPLGLPLGVDHAYPWGVGSSLAFTDSIPLVGVLLRPISAWLPSPFQYLGAWVLACFALQGFLGARLVRLLHPDALVQAAGGALFALSPPLLHRMLGPRTGHPALCAHWIVLGSLWVALAPVDPGRWRRRLCAALGWILLASSVHPYHLLVACALGAAFVVRLALFDRIVGFGAATAALGAMVACALAGSAAFGFVGTTVATTGAGFGLHSADLTSLVNPMGWSRLWAGVAVGEKQYEGFGFLGAGALALALVGAVAAVRGRERLGATRWRLAVPAAVVTILLAVFSLSGQITLAGSPLLRVDAYRWVPWLGGVFRSPGRFVWSLHYAIVLAALAALAAVWRERPRRIALVAGGALALQVADVRPPVPMPAPWWTPAAADAWTFARGRYRHVALVPPILITGDGPAARECQLAFGATPYLRAAELALRFGATYDSAYVARIDPVRAGLACSEAIARVAEHRLDGETIYVVHPGLLGAMSAAGATCGALDGMSVCVDAGRGGPFAAALGAGSTPADAERASVEPRR
jgi:hypothetical protein